LVSHLSERLAARALDVLRADNFYTDIHFNIDALLGSRSLETYIPHFDRRLLA